MGLKPKRESDAELFARWADEPDVMVRELFGVEPDPWQVEVLQAFPVTQRLSMQASKGPGKAQPLDTTIETPDGPRKFGHLLVGDSVFGADGHPTKITAIFEQGNLPIYRVVFDDNSETLACGDHLWRVKGAAERVRKNQVAYQRTTQAQDIWSVLTTEEIIARGVRNKNGRWAGRQFEIPRQAAVQYPTAILPLDPYVLGVWIGDGVRLGGTYATKPTAEIEDEIRRRGYRTSGPRNGIVAVYGIAVSLRGLGMFPLYSHERYIPYLYRRGDAQQRRDLLCGLMDTDGEIADDGHMGFSSTSHELVEDVIWLVRSLGGVAYEKKPKQPFYYGKNREKIGGRTCYRVTMNLPFNPFRVPHRRERWRDPYRNASTIRYMTRKIDRIERAGEAECRCIAVDAPDHLYLTNDFIVTHNTCVLAWIAWNFLLTRPHPKIAATSITGDNLSDGLWTEMSKWQQRSPMLDAMFKWTKTRIEHKEKPETWWMAHRTWPKTGSATEQANALAGLHADYVLFLLDESGGIPDAVMVTAEAALSAGIETHIVQAGNPTNLDGPLYRAATKDRRLWTIFEVNGDPDNPKRAPRVDMQWARQMIESYGRNHPYVLVNVLGRFPPASMNSLIGPDEISAAQRRSYTERDIEASARLVGIDVARFGDDKSVLFKRQGLVAFNPIIHRNLDGPQGAGITARLWGDWDADAVFIDDTGGYGATWIDSLRLLGRQPIGVQFAGSPNDARYVNKRAEMYMEAVKWIRAGGQLPPSDVPGMSEFTAAMTTTTYTFRGDRMIIEPKELIKGRLGYSPDEADGFVLTFAQPIAMRRGYQTRQMGSNVRKLAPYDPFASLNMPGTGPQPRVDDYSPW